MARSTQPMIYCNTHFLDRLIPSYHIKVSSFYSKVDYHNFYLQSTGFYRWLYHKICFIIFILKCCMVMSIAIAPQHDKHLNSIMVVRMLSHAQASLLMRMKLLYSFVNKYIYGFPASQFLKFTFLLIFVNLIFRVIVKQICNNLTDLTYSFNICGDTCDVLI